MNATSMLWKVIVSPTLYADWIQVNGTVDSPVVQADHEDTRNTPLENSDGLPSTRPSPQESIGYESVVTSVLYTESIWRRITLVTVVHFIIKAVWRSLFSCTLPNAESSSAQSQLHFG